VLVGLHAGLAVVDGADGHAHELELGLGGRGLRDALHAQASGLLAVRLFADLVTKAVVDVVHAHEGGGGASVVHVRRARAGERLLLEGVAKRGVPGGDRAGEGDRVAKGLSKGAVTQHGAEVELEVAREVRNAFGQRNKGAHDG